MSPSSNQTISSENGNPSGSRLITLTQTSNLIPQIRSASRLLVRELGFMSPTLANTQLSPSSVHALLEINSSNEMTATILGHVLNLEKSSVSRMVKKLVEQNLVEEELSSGDKREKFLGLTEEGRSMVSNINSWADQQVEGTLAKLPNPEADAKTVLEGIKAYAEAWRARRLDTSLSPPSKSLTEPQKPTLPQDISIKRGYQPGILARCLEMHMSYYSSTVGFGVFFEARLSTGLGELLERMESGKDAEVWAAVSSQKIVGTVWMDDGSAPHYESGDTEKGCVKRAHLRAFIVDGSMRGKGVGSRLISEAMKWAEEKGFAEVELWTFKGLDAARKLYDAAGFVLKEEMVEPRWGPNMCVQHFVRERIA